MLRNIDTGQLVVSESYKMFNSLNSLFRNWRNKCSLNHAWMTNPAPPANPWPSNPTLLWSAGASSRTLDYSFLQGELDALWSPLHSVSSLHQLGRSMSRSVIGPEDTSQGCGAKHSGLKGWSSALRCPPQKSVKSVATPNAKFMPCRQQQLPASL